MIIIIIIIIIITVIIAIITKMTPNKSIKVILFSHELSTIKQIQHYLMKI